MDDPQSTSPNGGWRKIILDSQLFINLKSPTNVCLVNLNSGYLNFDISEQGIKRALDKHEYAQFYQERSLVADFTYSPHLESVISTNEAGGEVFNTYKPPTWKHDNYFFKTPLAAPPQMLPPLLDRYFSHLVGGDSASREYLLDWLATALKARNYTILTAIGEPGIGKGKLGEIMSKLVGDSNFARVRDTVFKKQFNAPLRNKQLVYVDEVSLTTNEEIDRVKDVVNNRIEIERKGEDPEEIDNHASFYLTSNRMDAVKIESSDRRFSIIQLTDVSLLKNFSIPEIQQLTEAAQIEQLALYLLNRTVRSDMGTPFRSARYDEVLEAGLTEWELHLVEHFLPTKPIGSIVPLSEFTTEISKAFQHMKRPPGRHRLEQFVRKYSNHMKLDRHKGERRITILRRFDLIQ